MKKYNITGSDEFLNVCKELVVEYQNNHLDPTDNVSITVDDVYAVSSCFILGNQKAFLSTTLPDGMYFEITYDRNNDCIYFDAYKRFHNKKIE